MPSVPARHLAGALAALDVADVRAAVDALDDERAVLEALRRIQARAEDHAGLGVPVSGAATLLRVTPPTVRSWIDRGVLDTVPGSSPLLVASSSLGEALAAVRTLREAGKHRVLDAAVEVLGDRRTRHDLDDRLAQLAAGDIVEVDVDHLEHLFQDA